MRLCVFTQRRVKYETSHVHARDAGYAFAQHCLGPTLPNRPSGEVRTRGGTLLAESGEEVGSAPSVVIDGGVDGIVWGIIRNPDSRSISSSNAFLADAYSELGQDADSRREQREAEALRLQGGSRLGTPTKDEVDSAH